MPDPQSLSDELTKSTLAALALAGVYQNLKLASLHAPANPLPNMAVEGLGLRVPKGKIIPRPTPLIVTWLAPQPVGVVPPHYYGLPERYFFGHSPEDVFSFLTGEKAKQGAEARQRLVLAQKLSEELQTLKGQTQLLTDAQLNTVAAALAQLRQLRETDEYFFNRVDPLIGLNAEVFVEQKERAEMPRGSVPAAVVADTTEPPKLRRPVGAAVYAVASALASLNPPDP